LEFGVRSMGNIRTRRLEMTILQEFPDRSQTAKLLRLNVTAGAG